MRPKARKSEVLVQPVGDEVVLYDQRSNRAHRLSPIAGVLWHQCDGTKTIEGLAACLHDELGTPAEDTGSVIHGIDMLAQADLLENGSQLRNRLFDRREALIAAAALVPMVTSIVAPTPAHAQSFFPPPPPRFNKFNGSFEGRSVLISADGFEGFSNQVQAVVTTDVDDESGTGPLDLETIPKKEYDLTIRAYEVEIFADGTIRGEGAFTTAQGVAVTCSINGTFNATCNRIVFEEEVVFDNHIGTAKWEITARR